jgi:Tfp pilus assembly protein PilN
MIKINLLDSVTEQTRGVAAIEARVANPRAQTMLVMLSVFGLMLLGMGLDWVSASTKLSAAQEELKNQQEIARQMEAINKEQAELEKKTKDVQTRIDAIKRLRSSQKGPVAVLSSINERLPRMNDFFLTSIEQKGEELTVMGNSPNEAAVTQFGRSLEFSSGLFTNVSIATQRKELDVKVVGEDRAAQAEKAEPKPETVTFTIKCKYTVPGQKEAQQQQAAAKSQGGQQVAEKR